METATYLVRRGQLEQYFDRTAVQAWARLTSDGPVSRIRATVRAGRERMRTTLLGYLPADLRGQRVLDAGCGTGALAVEAARRGAEVVAIDLSPTLVDLARQRAPAIPGPGSVEFRVSDMLDPSLGRFEWIVAMDSLIHYEADDMLEMVARLAVRASRGVAFTFAPGTLLLRLMHLVGKAFPRGHRSPAIAPIAERALRRRVTAHPGLRSAVLERTERVDTAFYKSQAVRLVTGEAA